MFDILKTSDGLIGHGTGIVNVNGKQTSPFQNSKLIIQNLASNVHLVEFRLIVFRPFKGEIILGKISSSSEYGIKSTLPTLNAGFRERLTSHSTPRLLRRHIRPSESYVPRKLLVGYEIPQSRIV